MKKKITLHRFHFDVFFLLNFEFAIVENEDVESIHTRMTQLKTFEDEISLLRTAVRLFSSNRREFTEMSVIHLLDQNLNLTLEFETGQNLPVNRTKNNTAQLICYNKSTFSLIESTENVPKNVPP